MVGPDPLEGAMMLPAFCPSCLSLIVHGCGFTDEDPWQALGVVVQLGLFQATSRDARFWQRAGGQNDPKTISLVLAEIGCLGCFKPKTRDALIRSVNADGFDAVARRVRTQPTEDYDA